MAMDASSFSDDLYKRLKNDMGLTDFGDDKLGNLKSFCKAITDEIVKHITKNAEVTSSTIASSGVMVNGGAAGLAPYIGPVVSATGIFSDGALTDGK